MRSRGIIIDLCSNPGGEQTLAEGMARWFVENDGQWPGTIRFRDAFQQTSVNYIYRSGR
jgi:C-terminal processing protease CtpA/Prc